MRRCKEQIELTVMSAGPPVGQPEQHVLRAGAAPCGGARRKLYDHKLKPPELTRQLEPQGFLSVNLNSTYYELAQRHAAVPRLTPAQREALAAVGALALGDELRLDIALRPGDLQLLSNFSQLHTRSAFLDPEARARVFALKLPVLDLQLLSNSCQLHTRSAFLDPEARLGV